MTVQPGILAKLMVIDTETTASRTPEGPAHEADDDADWDSEHAAEPVTTAVDSIRRALVFSPADAGRRLDLVLAGRLPEFSRSRLQQWIDDGFGLLDGRTAQRKTKLRGGERVLLDARLPREDAYAPEPIPLVVVFEDEHLLIVDKPAGLVVHPAAGNWTGTLLNGLLHHDPTLAALPRCGIVHRLDKDTTGLLAVAKTLSAHTSLVAQLRERTVAREYRALVVGSPPTGGSIDEPIGRHPTRRTEMAVTPSGRPARTDFSILARYPGHTLLAVKLHTGRTHQIRVHLTHAGYPLVGDPTYGRRRRMPQRGSSEALGAPAQRSVSAFSRQALHAAKLGLRHPASGEAKSWAAPIPADLAALLATLGGGADA
jgi:23S rRNA pseudouridine1911/1915/1917 synthase